MAKYRVHTAESRLLVRARSSIHDTTTTWSAIVGDIEADAETLESAGAQARFSVDMTAFDAGDWLKNRKLKKDLNVATYPQATFELSGVRNVERTSDGQFSALATGVLRWHGRQIELTIAGQGQIDQRRISAKGTFDLDIRTLGIEPPRFLMFKVDNEVTVEVTLRAVAA